MDSDLHPCPVMKEEVTALVGGDCLVLRKASMGLVSGTEHTTLEAGCPKLRGRVSVWETWCHTLHKDRQHFRSRYPERSLLQAL